MTRKKVNNFISLPVHDFEVPLEIILERRSTIRVALGKNSAILRVPTHVKSQMPNHIQMAQQWLHDIAEKSPEMLVKYHIKRYSSSSTLMILERDKYNIIINHCDKEDGIVTLKNNILEIEIPNHLSDFEKSKLIRELISKILIKRYRKIVSDRVHLWNTHFFKKNISGITLRYKNTNWGSCSSSNKISISTRCLLLPLDVFDYIIVHELSHLVEMNHSKKFWNVVSSVMPNYEEKENWIKTNGTYLDF